MTENNNACIEANDTGTKQDTESNKEYSKMNENCNGFDENLVSGYGQYHTDKDREKDGKVFKGKDYLDITLNIIRNRAIEPQSIDKKQAQWFIPSTLMSRVHAEQRTNGKFYALWADIDKLEIEGKAEKIMFSEIVASFQNTILPDTKAILYTTSSATPDNQKSRIIIPLSEPVDGQTYIILQTILNDKLMEMGITPDRASQRANQICFLPNKGIISEKRPEIFYLHEILDGHFFNHSLWVAEIESYQERLKQEHKEQLRRQEIAKQQVQNRIDNGQSNPMQAYKDAYPIETALEMYGYVRHGDKWLSPNSESGNAALVVKDGKAYSHHGSDAGIPKSDKGVFDAFDLFNYFECDGDPKAKQAIIKTGEMFYINGITINKHNQIEYMKEEERKTLENQARLKEIQIEKYNESLNNEEPPPKRPEMENIPKPESEPESRRLKLIKLGDIEFKEPDWLIYGMIEMDSLALIFGDPGCGKSFVGIDIASCVATGHSFNGKRVKQGSVIYIAGEGQNGLKRRFMAWSIHKNINLDDKPIYLSLVPAEISSKESINIIQEEMKRIIESDNCPYPVLIIIDTLARNFGSGDENSTKDMNEFIKGVDRLRSFYGSSMLVIHHTGHGDKQRARGAFCLKGSLETEIRLDKDKTTEMITMTCIKQKDHAKPQPVALSIESVNLGIKDYEGKEVTSAVLSFQECKAPEPKKAPEQKSNSGRGKNQQLLLTVLDGMVKKDINEETGLECQIPASLSEWQNKICTNKGKEGMPPYLFKRIIKALEEQGLISIDNDFVYRYQPQFNFNF